VVVEARLGCASDLEICVKVGPFQALCQYGTSKAGGSFAYVNAFSSSITCMPRSYCSFVGVSPTGAKWPFIVMTEGAVALDAADGLRPFTWVFAEEDMVARRRN
jgi:hypothetical protein